MTGRDEQLRRQVEEWRNDLVDLTRRNRLLNFKPGSRSAVLQLLDRDPQEILDRLPTRQPWRFHYPEPTPDEETDAALIAALNTEDTELTDELLPDELITDAPTARRLSSVLHTLERKASTEFIDKGLRVLYLAVGLLHWADGDGTELTSPLLMVPVTLSRPSPREPFRLSGTEDDASINPALAVKLEHDFGLTIPDDVDDLDVRRILDSVAEAVAPQRGWRVSHDVVLGAFSFHKESMYRDLKQNEDAICAHPIIRSLALGEPSEGSSGFGIIPDDEIDQLLPPEEMVSILDADSTQRRCIGAARLGQTFVMDGPPGSGKSQTIANMIAELMAAGKSILFVSEKAAALEVVKNRLDDASLGYYVLELHSAKATRKDVAQELGRALNERPRASGVLSANDREALLRRRNELSAYAAAQNEVRQPLGRSLHWVLGRCASLSPVPAAPLPESVDESLSATMLSEILDAASTLGRSWAPISNAEQFLWRDLADPTAASRHQSSIGLRLDEMLETLNKLRDVCAMTTDELGMVPVDTFERVDRLVRLGRLIQTRPPAPPHWLTSTDLGALDATRQERQRLCEDYAGHAAELRRLSGSLCESLEPRLSEVIETAADYLTRGEPSAATVLDGSLDNVIDRRRGLDDLRKRVHDVTAATGNLGTALGVAIDDPSWTQARTIAELAALVGSPNLPEPQWLDQTHLVAARDAIGVLRPIIDRYRELGAQISTIFTPEVAQFDIDALYDGDSDLTPKLGRFNSRGRTNRKQLKACVTGGKVTDQAIAALPLVRQWRRTATELASAEQGRADVLGTHYYQHDHTDFSALYDALSVAEKALALVGSTANNDSFSSSLSRSNINPEQLVGQGRQLAQAVADLDASAGQAVPGSEAPLRSLPATAVLAWIDRRAAEIDPLVSALSVVQEATGQADVAAQRRAAWLRRMTAHHVAELDRTSEPDRQQFGAWYDGVDTDWTAIAEGISWASKVRATLDASPTNGQAGAILAAQLEADSLESTRDEWTKKLDSLADWFVPEYAEELRSDASGQLDDAEELLQQLRATIAQIDVWVSYQAARSRLSSAGLQDAVAYAEQNAVAAELIPSIVERAVLTAFADEILATDARCHPLRGDQRDAAIEEYRRLDRALIASASAKVIDACNARRPTTMVGEPAVIQAEAAKKRRHRPIRTLLGEAGNAARALKPCFMMSPLSVSQFLPADLTFDVVIFDEASQVRPADAINAIYRGAQLMVAGDDKQLPPTSFFDRMSNDADDEYDEEELEVFESVLDHCKGSAQIPSLPLRWHYRSRHEALITYSNHAFYGGSLITYPGAMDSAPDFGVEFMHVPDGVYMRGAGRDNPIEAQFVVERVIHHADHHPHLTVGVVAFSEAQATRISYELEAARRSRPDLDEYFAESRLGGFFVKNLENVQGDERDIIIFSIGYGRDEAGKFTMNFGPINKDGGHRRLNVAITRAKQRVEVVSSVRAADFQPSNSPGVRHLKQYLDYAERGFVALAADPGDEIAGEPESPFEEDVLATIRDWGYDVQSQVGQAGYRIDLGVRHPAEPGRYVLGVECDGAAYHSSRSARDRDRLRQEVLEGLGWHLHRIWGPAWYRDRQAQEERLRVAIQTAIEGPRQEAASPPAASSIATVEVDDFEFDDQPDWVVDYQTTYLPPPKPGTSMADPAVRSELRAAIEAVVRQEGPIHRELCLQRVRKAWSVGRAGAKIRDAFDQSVRALQSQGSITESEPGFLDNQSPKPLQVRRPVDSEPDTFRKANEVPPAEVRLALQRLVEHAHSITEDELTTRAARLFGWNRRGVEITLGLQAALEQLTEAGVLRANDQDRLEAAT